MNNGTPNHRFILQDISSESPIAGRGFPLAGNASFVTSPISPDELIIQARTEEYWSAADQQLSDDSASVSGSWLGGSMDFDILNDLLCYEERLTTPSSSTLEQRISSSPVSSLFCERSGQSNPHVRDYGDRSSFVDSGVHTVNPAHTRSYHELLEEAHGLKSSHRELKEVLNLQSLTSSSSGSSLLPSSLTMDSMQSWSYDQIKQAITQLEHRSRELGKQIFSVLKEQLKLKGTTSDPGFNLTTQRLQSYTYDQMQQIKEYLCSRNIEPQETQRNEFECRRSDPEMQREQTYCDVYGSASHQREGRVRCTSVTSVNDMMLVLGKLVRRVYQSIPFIPYQSMRDSFSYRHVKHLLVEFKITLHTQLHQLLQIKNWEAVLRYIVRALCATHRLPIWDNESHNAMRSGLFEVLTAACLKAMKHLKWNDAKLEWTERHLTKSHRFDKRILPCLQYIKQLRSQLSDK